MEQNDLSTKRTYPWVGWVLAILPSALTVMSGVAKIMGSKEVIDGMTQMGFIEHRYLLGVSEIIFVLLFLWPKTLNLGFFLLCGYFGGAIATHMGHAMSPLAPAVVLAVFWIAALIRKPSLFLG